MAQKFNPSELRQSLCHCRMPYGNDHLLSSNTHYMDALTDAALKIARVQL